MFARYIINKYNLFESLNQFATDVTLVLLYRFITDSDKMLKTKNQSIKNYDCTTKQSFQIDFMKNKFVTENTDNHMIR